MRKSRFGILRVFALLAMMVSVSGVYTLTASAAPANTGSTPRVQAQSAELCTTLYWDEVVDANGSYIWQTQWGWDQIGGLTAQYGISNGVAVSIAFGGCWGKVDTTPPAVTTTVNLVMADGSTPTGLDVQWVIYTNDGDFVDGGSGPIDIPATLFSGVLADGGYYAVIDSAGYQQTSGAIALGETTTFALEAAAPELVRTLVHVTPLGVAGTVTGTCDGQDVSGAFGEDGWGDLGNFAVGVQCDLTLSADGYEAGFVSGTTFANFDYAMIEGELGAAIPVPTFAWNVFAVYDGGDGSFPVIEGATVEFDGIPESGLTGPDGRFTTAGAYEPGDYTVTVSADGYVSQTLTISFSEATQSWSVVLEPIPAPVTYPVTITGLTDDGGSAEGALVYIQSADDNGAQTFAQNVPAADGVLDADNNFNTELEAGEYVVTIDAIDQGYSYNFTQFSVPTEGPVVVELNSPSVETGFVHIHNFVCDGIDKVIFGDDVDAVGKDCDPAAGTFTFYLVGDGTDDHWQVKVGASGINGIELAPGTYEVVVEENQAKTEVTVVEGEVTELVVQNPAPAEKPDNGGKKDEGKKNESEVKELPKTGTGHEAGTMNTALMLSVAAAVTATAGGYVLRQKRS